MTLLRNYICRQQNWVTYSNLGIKPKYYIDKKHVKRSETILLSRTGEYSYTSQRLRFSKLYAVSIPEWSDHDMVRHNFQSFINLSNICIFPYAS